MDGMALPMNQTLLRSALAAAKVTVLTSSSGDQQSKEDPLWQHGAFTKGLSINKCYITEAVGAIV
jgi:hypothetical protein